MTPPAQGDPFDLFVIGGGVNGCAIARDAAGRGMSVALAEAGDIGGATSSASTKLIHGGLRYLEYGEVRLVRAALAERAVLLAAMPHIAHPMRFVLPLGRGRRPAWMIRLGLFLYDRLGGRGALPGTRALDLTAAPEGAALKPDLTRAFAFSDGWVDDARLVVLIARDAADRGARILPRTRVTAVRRAGALWQVRLADAATGAERTAQARALVNAAGPWVGTIAGAPAAAPLRLVRGSHIVTRRLFDHSSAYFLQGADGRIVFVLPYEDDFTLIGTTEVDHPDPDATPTCTEGEQDYLCAFVSDWFRRPVTRADIVWTFAGVRALIDAGRGPARAASRDYALTLDADGAPLMTVLGGKITTHRRLAEQALDRLAPHLNGAGGAWTAGIPLPGGDFPQGGAGALADALRARYPFLDAAWARRLARAYGTDAARLLGAATTRADLGQDFGATLTEAEVCWMTTREFARTARDIVWRRSKLGLRLTAAEIAALEDWLAASAGQRNAPAPGQVGDVLPGDTP